MYKFNFSFWSGGPWERGYLVCVAYMTNLIPRLMHESGNEVACGGLHIVCVTGQDS